jgi:hypothetical protein
MSAESTELRLFIDNDADLHRQIATSIYKNLATKKARGEYRHDLAVKAFGYLVEAGAKKYAKEFGGTWHQMFDVATRRAVAEELTDSFEAEAKLGNYDHLLPKKYQGAVPEKHRQKIAKQTARMPAAMRGVMGGNGKKSPAQLQREIDESLATRRGR